MAMLRNDNVSSKYCMVLPSRLFNWKSQVVSSTKFYNIELNLTYLVDNALESGFLPWVIDDCKRGCNGGRVGFLRELWALLE